MGTRMTTKSSWLWPRALCSHALRRKSDQAESCHPDAVNAVACLDSEVTCVSSRSIVVNDLVHAAYLVQKRMKVDKHSLDTNVQARMRHIAARHSALRSIVNSLFTHAWTVE